jgi:ornithine cyclodeaminase/alanine dehydrogenase
LLLSRSQVSNLLHFDDYVRVVEEAFRLHGQGKVQKTELLHLDSVDGEFHIKAGVLDLNRRYFAIKVNGGFFRNTERFGMPNIQGAILLCDGENGYPLAVMDSREITINRTGAVAAVAARHLARPGKSTVTICGCGTQGRIQLLAMDSVLPIERAYAFDADAAKASAFAQEMSALLKIEVSATVNLHEAARASSVCVTCTPARHYYLSQDDVGPGTFIAAMGADSPDKQELHPALLKTNKVVVDILDQCAGAGELHHALEDGMRREDVYAELGEIIAGAKKGRISDEEIIIFDATGTALQDVAAAAAVYEKARAEGLGSVFDLFA